MSNQPKTPHRTVRIAAELWTRTQTKAYAEGRSVTDVIREALERYVSEPSDRLPS